MNLSQALVRVTLGTKSIIVPMSDLSQADEFVAANGGGIPKLEPFELQEADMLEAQTLPVETPKPVIEGGIVHVDFDFECHLCLVFGLPASEFGAPQGAVGLRPIRKGRW